MTEQEDKTKQTTVAYELAVMGGKLSDDESTAVHQAEEMNRALGALDRSCPWYRFRRRHLFRPVFVDFFVNVHDFDRRPRVGQLFQQVINPFTFLVIVRDYSKEAVVDGRKSHDRAVEVKARHPRAVQPNLTV